MEYDPTRLRRLKEKAARNRAAAEEKDKRRALKQTQSAAGM